jgi:hypothetical protein
VPAFIMARARSRAGSDLHPRFRGTWLRDA